MIDNIVKRYFKLKEKKEMLKDRKRIREIERAYYETLDAELERLLERRMAEYNSKYKKSYYD